MRVRWTTGLLALLLLCSLGAQASQIGQDPSPEPSTDAVDIGLTDLEISDPQGSAPPQAGDPPQTAPPADLDAVKDEAERTAEEARAEAESQAQGVLDNVDLDRLQQEVDHAVRDAQDALPPITGSGGGDAPDTARPEMEPQASVSQSWPDVAPPLLLAAGTAATIGLLLWFAGNSATVGAGAAGTAAAASEGRRFLPFASPLFTRFEKDTVLGHPKREAIYGRIVESPGATLQDLCDHSGLSRTAVSHHLRLLEQQHLVVAKRVGRSKHFFENGGRFGRDQKDAYAVLHNQRSKDIHKYIASNPGSIQKDLCRALGIQASVAHWHVKRLKEANLIQAVRQGRTVSYFPAQHLQRAGFA